MPDKLTIEKLENMGKGMVAQVDAGGGPTFETVLRSRGNTLYDEGMQCLRLGDKKELRKFLSVAQAKTFMQTVAVASKTKRFVNENLHTSIRGLYYQLKFTLGEDVDEDLFSEQSESNSLIEDLEVALALKREDLHLTTDRKGVLAGPIRIRDSFAGDENIIDGTKQGRSGWMIPSDVDNGMEFVDVNANYVLVVEKDALWQRLNEDQFWKKDNCLIITPKGQASRGTRRLIRKLADKGLPIYVFSIDGGETVPIMDNDGCLRNERIEELIEQNNAGSVYDGFSERVSIPYHSIELTKEGAVEKGRILFGTKHPIAEDMYEIVGKNGKRVKTTKSHSIMAFDAEKFEIRESTPLELKGKYLISMTPPNIERISKINVEEAAKKAGLNYKIKDNRVHFGIKTQFGVPKSIGITPDFAKLLGFIVAEGHFAKRVILTFNSKEKKYVDEVEETARAVFGMNSSYHSPQPSATQIGFGGISHDVLFADVLGIGRGAENKRVPWVLFNAPSDVKKAFLAGYFAGDGGFIRRKKGIRLYAVTASRALASDLLLLMDQLGVASTLQVKMQKKANYPTHVISIQGNDILKLPEILSEMEINYGEKRTREPVYPSIPYKVVKQAKKLMMLRAQKSWKQLQSREHIPLVALSKIFGQQPKMIYRVFANANGENAVVLAKKTDIAYRTAYKALKTLKRMGLLNDDNKKTSEGARLYERLGLLETMIRSGTNLIEVKSVGKASSTDGFVYDIAVNPNHTFFAGPGGIAVHNTDCDAWGWYIYWTIKTGSMNLAYLGRDFAIPEAHFLGVTMQDIQDFEFLQKLTIRAKDVDIKRAEEMLSYPWISRHKPWVKELQTVLKTKKKIEQDALQGRKLTFVGEYLRQKIREKNWLP